ncbi:DUF427 domain-containing protein [Rhodohalobacter mucosus]|uniref:DUF427 domain-containing protein n=1 Tax=Rhodohalobacter mucosus TaxID=2079485 RepID=A0A316TTU9_9BACT|nr:DUF427 domain-containing protein [Rhodohalobacter mucosus]PWN07298.1 hypothetical protein DDZ15_03250 [Rhodohalobacter mucosus]
MWKYTGNERPPFAIEPEEGEESVWDYPRPPITDPDSRTIIVEAGDSVIAKTNRAVRVLETASPPTFYIPPADVNEDLLEKASGSSFCEWKGSATYWNITLDGQNLRKVAWSYHNPSSRFKLIDGYYSFYPGKVRCFVDGERVQPQPGQFYGGWVTSEIVGPMKGESGTGGW